MAKYKSITHTAYPPNGWMAKPKTTDKNYELKLSFWKVRLQVWLNGIYNN